MAIPNRLVQCDSSQLSVHCTVQCLFTDMSYITWGHKTPYVFQYLSGILTGCVMYAAVTRY